MSEEKEKPEKLTWIDPATGRSIFTEDYINFRIDILGPIDPQAKSYHDGTGIEGNMFGITKVNGKRVENSKVNEVIRQFIEDWKKEHPDGLP